jgi:hypothetical protein
MHHKYMIVDQNAPASDPLVLTGSHNWSAAAANDNDENTVIVHDATIANLYYQNFVKRFVENDGVLFELTGPPTAVNDSANTVANETVTVAVLANDIKQAPVTVSIDVQAANGSAYIPFNNPNVISYLPNTDFKGDDSVTYKISYNASPDLYATAKIYIKVAGGIGISETSGKYRLLVFPNPVQNGNLNIACFLPSADNGTIQLHDITGKLIFERNIRLTNGENILNYTFPSSCKGIYLIRLTTTNSVWNQKVLFE